MKDYNMMLLIIVQQIIVMTIVSKTIHLWSRNQGASSKNTIPLCKCKEARSVNQERQFQTSKMEGKRGHMRLPSQDTLKDPKCIAAPNGVVRTPKADEHVSL